MLQVSGKLPERRASRKPRSSMSYSWRQVRKQVITSSMCSIRLPQRWLGKRNVHQHCVRTLSNSTAHPPRHLRRGLKSLAVAEPFIVLGRLYRTRGTTRWLALPMLFLSCMLTRPSLLWHRPIRAMCRVECVLRPQATLYIACCHEDQHCTCSLFEL